MGVLDQGIHGFTQFLTEKNMLLKCLKSNLRNSLKVKTIEDNTNNT